MTVINLVIGILGAGIGSGIMMIVHALLQRKWQKEDRSTEKMDAQTEALKVIMIDRVRELGKEFIKQHYISLDDKKTLKEMYHAYKRLGGNSHLETIIDEVNKLEVRQE